MNTIILDNAVFRIPHWVTDVASFRRWVHSAEFPEEGRVCFLRGEVVVDMTKEQVFSHNQVKSEFNITLGGFIKANHLGRYFPDGVLFSHPPVELSGQPDAAFASRDSLQTGRIRLLPGAKEGFVELEGSLEMVLEVVSDSSVQKDTVVLMDLYWQAGVREYWLVDARGDELVFKVYHHDHDGYIEADCRDGWVESKVFERSFRLLREMDSMGLPQYTLSIGEATDRSSPV